MVFSAEEVESILISVEMGIATVYLLGSRLNNKNWRVQVGRNNFSLKFKKGYRR